MRFSFYKILIIAILAASFAVPTQAASPSSEYLSLRKQFRIKAPTNAGYLQSNFDMMCGQVVEVRGVIAGVARSDNSCTFILRMEPGSETITISATRLDIPELTTGNRVRVLAKVPEGASSYSSLEFFEIAPEYVVAPYDPKVPPKPVEPTRKQVALLTATPTVAKPAAGSRAQRGDDITGRGATVLAAYCGAIRCFNRKLSDSQVETIARHILNYSYNNGVDARLVMAVVAVESGFNPTATSRAGAMGLGQLMPGTARGLGVSNAYNAEDNLAGAVKLIRGHLDKFNGKPVWEQIALAMACYNAGSGAVRKYGGVPPYRETQNYVRKVAGLYKRFLGAK